MLILATYDDMSAFIQLFWVYAKFYKKRLFLTLVTLFIATIAFIVLSQGVKKGISHFLLSSDIPIIPIVTFLGMGLFLLGFTTYSRIYHVLWLGEKITNDIRVDLYQKLIRAPLSFFENIKIGHILSALNLDLFLIQGTLCSGLSIFMRNTLIFFGSLYMMLTSSMFMSGYSIIFLPIILYPLFLYGKKVRCYSYQAQEIIGDYHHYIEDNLSNIKTVQTFTREPIEDVRSHELGMTCHAAAMKTAHARAWLSTWMFFCAFLGAIILLFFGKYELAHERISVENLTSFLVFFAAFCGSIASFGNIAGDFHKACGASLRILDIIKKIPQTSLISYKPIKNPKGILAFHNVSFSYPTQPLKKVLDHISFSAHPKEVVAIVGPNGAGKSTIFSLLLKFYTPASGHIYIEGIDSDHIHPFDIRQHISYAQQEPAIFCGTFLDNLLYGCPNVLKHHVDEIVEKTGLDRVIQTLPKGIFTPLGSKGFSLSGGQKQRLSLARALLRPSKILLLDEPTNFLDSSGQDIFKNNFYDGTTLIIAHRLQTILSADKIIVMSKGKIETIGTHGELMTSSDFYQNFVRFEAGGG